MVRAILLTFVLSGCAANTLDGTFRGEAIELEGVTMFHWSDGLQDQQGGDLTVDRIALSFSETADLCERQRAFLQAAAEQDVPLPLEHDQYDAHAALFEEHFPVVGRWDMTFWIGLPDGTDELSALEVDLAPSFDGTYLNAEAVASRWDRVPPGDLLTWRSEDWYGEFGETWTSLSGTVRLDSFVAGQSASGSISAVFEEDVGEVEPGTDEPEQAELKIAFDVEACFGSS